MRVTAGGSNRDSTEIDGENQYECPCCRWPAERTGHRDNGRCPTCGSVLIPPARKIEADARERLYGGLRSHRVKGNRSVGRGPDKGMPLQARHV